MMARNHAAHPLHALAAHAARFRAADRDRPLGHPHRTLRTGTGAFPLGHLFALVVDDRGLRFSDVNGAPADDRAAGSCCCQFRQGHAYRHEQSLCCVLERPGHPRGGPGNVLDCNRDPQKLSGQLR